MTRGAVHKRPPVLRPLGNARRVQQSHGRRTRLCQGGMGAGTLLGTDGVEHAPSAIRQAQAAVVVVQRIEALL